MNYDLSIIQITSEVEVSDSHVNIYANSCLGILDQIWENILLPFLEDVRSDMICNGSVILSSNSFWLYYHCRLHM